MMSQLNTLDVREKRRCKRGEEMLERRGDVREEKSREERREDV